MSKIRIMILDDNPHQITEIVEVMNSTIKDFNTIAEVISFTDSLEGLGFLNTTLNKPNILFVDLQMPRLNGFEFVERSHYNKYSSEIIIFIISSFDDPEYVKKASELRLTYLFKGQDFETKIGKEIEFYLNSKSYKFKQLNLSYYTRVLLSEICYFEALGEYSRIHLKGEKVYEISRSLSEINSDSDLSYKGFVRIHDKYIVNKYNITSYKTEGRGCFYFSTIANPKTATINIGRTYLETSKQVKHLVKTFKK